MPVTKRSRWNEEAGTVSRAFDDWMMAEAEARWFMTLTLRISRRYFKQCLGADRRGAGI
jgi:hypothetical protein